MRKLINKVQDLSKKAAEIRQTVQGMPAKAAELREAVVMSATELQQIRSDVQNSLNGLRATSEDRVLQAMREINDHTYVFEDAGYELTGMDLDLAITQRLAVQFKKFEDTPLSQLRTLLADQASETIKSILSGLIKAEETAANVELTHLKYDGVIVDVGAVPLIRMLWRSDTYLEQQTVLETSPVQSSASASSSISSSAGFGSFFEQRTVPATRSAVTTVQATEPVNPSAAIDSTPKTAAEEIKSPAPAKTNALDRFKKMPDLTKPRY